MKPWNFTVEIILIEREKKYLCDRNILEQCPGPGVELSQYYLTGQNPEIRIRVLWDPTPVYLMTFKKDISESRDREEIETPIDATLGQSLIDKFATRVLHKTRYNPARGVTIDVIKDLDICILELEHPYDSVGDLLAKGLREIDVRSYELSKFILKEI